MNKIKKRTFLLTRPLLLSRHPTHSGLRAKNQSLPLFPFRSVVRLGSTTVLDDDSNRVQINTPQSVRNSASKLLMKQCFIKAGVKTANWYTILGDYAFKNNADGSKEEHSTAFSDLKYPIIAKSLYGSRGKGNTKFDNQEQLQNWISNTEYLERKLSASNQQTNAWKKLHHKFNL